MIPELATQAPSPTFPISDVPAVWPARRTAKACASCRRDKVKCDGARPCGACIKKNFQCTDGCEACRRARVRCEDGKPCTRCRTYRLECLDEPSRETASTLVLELPPLPTVPRGGRGRTTDRARLACLGCRRDNKKCDDQRPCTRCVARKEQCVHVSRAPKLVKLRCAACRQDNRKCEDTRPCQQCLDQGLDCVDVPRRGVGHGHRVKAACTNCRRDKIRCDGARPCSNCVRKEYPCIDRPCRRCLQHGKGSECTHRQARTPAPLEQSPAEQSSTDQEHRPEAESSSSGEPDAQPQTSYTTHIPDMSSQHNHDDSHLHLDSNNSQPQLSYAALSYGPVVHDYMVHVPLSSPSMGGPTTQTPTPQQQQQHQQLPSPTQIIASAAAYSSYGPYFPVPVMDDDGAGMSGLATQMISPERLSEMFVSAAHVQLHP